MTRVICLKQGHKYSEQYVRILHNRVRHYLPTIEEFVCYTDTPDWYKPSKDEGIELRLLPTGLNIQGWWYKCWILGQDHPGENLYFDLDMLITGDLMGYRPTEKGHLHGLWNIYHLNSSILGWFDSLPTVWETFDKRRGYHLSRGGTWGDQDVINECAGRGDFRIIPYEASLTAWLNVKPDQSLARNWTGTQKTVVCKGPRNPHEHTEHPLVQAYWRML